MSPGSASSRSCRAKTSVTPSRLATPVRVATSAASDSAGKRPLADDDRVHELDGEVLRVRRRRTRAEDDQLPATGEPAGHGVAGPGDQLGVRAERPARRLPALEELRGRRHPGTVPRAAYRLYRSRYASSVRRVSRTSRVTASSADSPSAVSE